LVQHKNQCLVRIFEFIKNCCFQFFSKIFQNQRTLGFNSLGKKIQNQRTTDPGYLKIVKETSGFYERSSGLWVSIWSFQFFWELWSILKTVVIFENRFFDFFLRIASVNSATMVVCFCFYYLTIHTSNILGIFCTSPRARTNPTHHTHWMKHPSDPGFFWACYEFQIFLTITLQINFKFWWKLVNSQANYNLFFLT
jgi:hypothetical protein